MALDKKDLIYRELSYKIVGILFEVYNDLGFGYQEKYYQRALVMAFKKHRLKFKEQLKVLLKYQNESIGYYRLDFLRDNKIVLEIKKGNYFPRSNIEKVFAYLKSAGCRWEYWPVLPAVALSLKELLI